MEIKLPPTLNASYEVEYAREYPFERPGEVVIKFGKRELTRVRVTQNEHDKLDASGFYSDHEVREEALEEFVADWLKARWNL